MLGKKAVDLDYRGAIAISDINNIAALNAALTLENATA